LQEYALQHLAETLQILIENSSNFDQKRQILIRILLKIRPKMLRRKKTAIMKKITSTLFRPGKQERAARRLERMSQQAPGRAS